MPARLRDLKRALAAKGVELEQPSSGSHWHFVRGTTAYPVPAHNGLKSEIGNEYIRGLCHAFAINFRELKKEL